jgi:hypothetical protein
MPHGEAVSFLSLQAGTPVVDRFGRPVGEVYRVLLHGDGSFDGIVVETTAGRRFVDAPEVRRIAHGAVNLGSTVDEVRQVGTGHRDGVPAASYGRSILTEADRDAAIEALKRAYVRDEIGIDELAGRVATAHIAEALEELDAALSGLAVE